MHARSRVFSNDELLHRAMMVDGRVRLRIVFQVQDPVADPTTGQTRLNRELRGFSQIMLFKSPDALQKFLASVNVLIQYVAESGEVPPVEEGLQLVAAKRR